MKNQFVKYIIKLSQIVPFCVYEILGIIFCLGSVILLAFWGLKKGIRYSSWLLVVEYVILLFSTTVLFRSYHKRLKYNLRPFWSYEAIQKGSENLLPEIIMNVVVFVPVGLLLGFASRSMTLWKVMLIGGGISVLIEAMQFNFQRGFAEVDDVVHNVLGCMLGYGVYSIAKYGYERIDKRRVGIS